MRGWSRLSAACAAAAIACTDDPSPGADGGTLETDAARADGAVVADSAPVTDGAPVADAAPIDASPTGPLPRRIAYLADQESDGVKELYLARVEGDTTTPAVKLNSTLIANGNVIAFHWSPDGRWIAYEADQESDNLFELYLVDVSGAEPGTPVKAHSSLAPGTTLGHVTWSPTSQRLVYIADQEVHSRYELWSVDTSGATPTSPQKVNTALPVDGWVNDVAWAPAGERLVYRADQAVRARQELWLADLSGATPGAPVRLNQELTDAERVYENSLGEPGWAWSPDGTKVAYRADSDIQNTAELFVVDVSGATPGAAQKVNDAYAGGIGVRWFAWSPDSQWLAWRRWETEVWVAEVGGATPGPPYLLTPYGTGGVFAPDSSAFAYHADDDSDGVVDLFAADLSVAPPPSVQVNPPLPAFADVTPVDANYQGYLWKPDGTKLLYHANQEVQENIELFVVDMTGGTPGAALKVNGSLATNGIVWAELGPAFAWDGDRLLYSAMEQVIGKSELYLADIGDATPIGSVKVNGTIVVNGDVYHYDTTRRYLWSRGASYAAYMADQDVDETVELYSVFIPDSPGPSVKLNGAMVIGGNVWSFAWEP